MFPPHHSWKHHSLSAVRRSESSCWLCQMYRETGYVNREKNRRVMGIPVLPSSAILLNTYRWLSQFSLLILSKYRAKQMEIWPDELDLDVQILYDLWGSIQLLLNAVVGSFVPVSHTKPDTSMQTHKDTRLETWGYSALSSKLPESCFFICVLHTVFFSCGEIVFSWFPASHLFYSLMSV